MFVKLKSQAEQRRMGHWDRISWELQDEEDLTKHIKLVQGRWGAPLTGDVHQDNLASTGRQDHEHAGSWTLGVVSCAWAAVPLLPVMAIIMLLSKVAN